LTSKFTQSAAHNSATTASGQQGAAGAEQFDLLTENVGRLLLLSFRLFERAFQRHAGDHGFGEIRMSHLPILRNIREEGSRTTEIAELSNLTKQAVGIVTNELEGMRYIKRFPDPMDGRAKLVRFTKKGLDFMAALPTILRDTEKEMGSGIGEENYRHLNQLLIDLVVSFGPDQVVTMTP